MRICPLCGKTLVVRTAKRGNNIGDQFFGCTNYPLCNYTEEIEIDNFPENLIHRTINDRYNYNHVFSPEDVKNLRIVLKFKSLNSFFYWISKQKIKYNGLSFHNHIEVGSPYNSTFDNLCFCINKNFDLIITKMLDQKSDQIYHELEIWFEERNRISKDYHDRKVEIQAEVESDRLQRSEIRIKKATVNIFNAIKRKDIKAIIALRIQGAILESTNNQGLTAIEYAKQLGDEKVIDALIVKLDED